MGTRLAAEPAAPPTRSVPRRGVRRAAGLLVAAMVGGGGAMALIHGITDGLVIALLLALMGAPLLVVSHLVARHRRRLGRLSWQLGLGVLIVLGLDLLSIGLVAMLWISARDALALALLLAFSGALAGYTAWYLTRDVVQDIARVQEAVAEVREGGGEQRVEVDAGEDELSALAAQVERMARELEQREAERDASERARRDLIAAVSHDLRTPLNSLRLICRAIEDNLVNEQTVRRYLGQIAFNIDSLDTLIEDLFELARIEAGDIEWSFEDLALDQLIRETLEGMASVAEQRGVELRLGSAPDLPPARANPEKIQRVLFNLVTNAFQHLAEGGRVSVTAVASGEEVEVDVADTGAGIPVADVERVFEPLWRGGEARASRPRDGAGLGLPISRSIIEAHGGRIYVAESSSRGTHIRFTLPRVGAPIAKQRRALHQPEDGNGQGAGSLRDLHAPVPRERE
jgi:signal transduction histidine kinase